MSTLEERIRAIEKAKIYPKVAADVEAFVSSQVNAQGEGIRHAKNNLIEAIVKQKLDNRVSKRIEELLALIQQQEQTP